MRHDQALENLRAVLCDPDGKCCIAGSEEDRRVVDEALRAFAATLPDEGAQGEAVRDVDDEMPLEYEAILAEFNDWCSGLSDAPDPFEAFEAAAHRYAAPQAPRVEVAAIEELLGRLRKARAKTTGIEDAILFDDAIRVIKRESPQVPEVREALENDRICDHPASGSLRMKGGEPK